MTRLLYPPKCPACSSSDARQEQGERHQCQRCGWRFVLLANGSTRDWLPVWRRGKTGAR